MSDTEVKKLVIVGGGFSGIAVASHLAETFNRYAAKGDKQIRLDITILDAKDKLGGSTFNRDRVNVPMANPIGVLGLEHGESFLKYMNENAEEWQKIAPQLNYTPGRGFDPQEFVTHNQYGIYLRKRLEAMLEKTALPGSSVKLDVKYSAEALDAWQGSGNDGDRVRLRLSNSETISADSVVLATGNVEPAPLPGLSGKKGYYNLDDKGLNPDNVNETDHTVLIGTGNGALFAVFSAIVNGSNSKFTLASNNGLLPQAAGEPSRPYKRTELTRVKLLDWSKNTGRRVTADKLKRRFLREVAVAKKEGFTWREVVDSIIPDSNRFWRMMDPYEREKFASKYGYAWTHARYRLPTEHQRLIEALQDSGRLELKGGVVGITPAESGGFDVLFDTGKGAFDVMHTDKIINNTGPSGKIEHMSSVMKALSQRGLIAQHQLGGVQSDDQMHLLGPNTKDRKLFYGIGTILRGEFSEAVTVPAIRIMRTKLTSSFIRDQFGDNLKEVVALGYYSSARKRLATKPSYDAVPIGFVR